MTIEALSHPSVRTVSKAVTCVSKIHMRSVRPASMKRGGHDNYRAGAEA
ncbi:hypothetical protein Rhow_000811 [Rhodococcus wratislaviensis]|uniref:Uncharacterized protein n=1 Tax=Rhodococcus wratislaviensis TaxID=44752 RepID=A0A402C2X9_RHOWR|nr:hypothetical protein Rhow_000811 [Rhodococcus wratislaviensis]